MCNQKIEVSKFDAPTKRWLYIRALILKDKTMVSQSPLQRNTKYREQKKKKITYPDKKEHNATIHLYHIYWHHSFIIAVSQCLSILTQAHIMNTIQISTMINNRSKIKCFYTKYLMLYFSNHLNERGNKKLWRLPSNSTIGYRERVIL